MHSPLHHLLLTRTVDVVPHGHVRSDSRRRLGVVLLVVLATVAIVTVTPGPAWGAPVTVKFDVVPAGTALDDQFGPLGVSGFSGPPQVTDCGTARTSASPLASSSPNLVSVGGSGELPSARTCIRLAQATNQAAVQVGAGSVAGGTPVPIKLTAYRDIKLIENPVIDSETKTITPGTSLAGSAKRLAVTDTGGRRIRYLVLQVGDTEQLEGRLPRLDDLVYDYEGLIAPQFTMSAAGSGKRLRAGSTVKQALTVLRFGMPGISDGPITLSAKDVPQGVTASFSPAVVSGSAESTDVTLTLTATSDAPQTPGFGTAYKIRGVPASAQVGPGPIEITASVDIVPGLILRAAGSDPTTEKGGSVELFSCESKKYPLTVSVPESDSPAPGPVTLGAGTGPGLGYLTVTPAPSPLTPVIGWIADPNATLTLSTGAVGVGGYFTVVAKAANGVQETLVIAVKPQPGKIYDVAPGGLAAPQKLKPGDTATVTTRGLCPGAKSLRFGNAGAIVPATFDGTHVTGTVPRLATRGIAVLSAGGSVLANDPDVDVSSYRNTHGFSFPNYPIAGISWSDIETFFGKGQVYDTIDVCWGPLYCPIKVKEPSALVVKELAKITIVDDAASGHCMGMGFMSVGFQAGKYKYGDFPGGWSSVFGRTGPNGPSGMLDDMLRRNSLRNFDWGFVSYWVGQTLKSPTAASIRAQVQGALAAGTPPLIALREGGSGHIVVAYDVEQTGANPNDYFIRVYDPNRPFVNGELATDGAAHAAMENASRIHVTPNSAWSFSHVSGSWGGSLNGVSAGLVVVPFGVFPAKPELPLEGLLSFTPAGIPNPFFGASNGTATATPLPVRATATGPGLVPLPILDAGADGYDLRVLRDGGPAKVRLEGTREGRYGGLFLGRGFVARLADVRTRAGERDTLVVDRARPVASFSTRADSKPFTLGLSLARASRRTSVQIHGISAKGGSERLSLAGGALQFRHTGAPTKVTLTLSTAGPGVAPETATTAPIALGRGDRLAVEPVELKKLDASLRVDVRSGKRIDRRSVRLESAARIPVRVTKVALAGRAVAITSRLPKVDADATLTVSYQLRRDGHVLQRGMTTVAGSRLRAGPHTARIPLKAAVQGRFKVQAAAVLATTGKTPRSGIAHRTINAHR